MIRVYLRGILGNFSRMFGSHSVSELNCSFSINKTDASRLQWLNDALTWPETIVTTALTKLNKWNLLLSSLPLCFLNCVVLHWWFNDVYRINLSHNCSNSSSSIWHLKFSCSSSSVSSRLTQTWVLRRTTAAAVLVMTTLYTPPNRSATVYCSLFLFFIASVETTTANRTLSSYNHNVKSD